MDPYWKRLPQLRHDVGVSQAELFRRAQGVGFDTIRALEQDPKRPRTNGGRSRARYPSPETLEAIAQGLGVDPGVFIEYKLAKARELLDERAIGLDRALANLEILQSALGEIEAVTRLEDGSADLEELARRVIDPEPETQAQQPTGRTARRTGSSRGSQRRTA